MPIRVAQNRPSLHGVEPDLLAHADAIVVGFTRVYRLLIAHRDRLLAPDGPIACFGGDEVRVIVRATCTYAALLYESLHPDMLRDALEPAIGCSNRLWGRVPYLQYLGRVVPFERRACREAIFRFLRPRPDSCDIWSGGRERISGFLAEPSLAAVWRSAQSLSEQDLARQLWLVRAALSTQAQGGELAVEVYAPTELPLSLASRTTLLDASCMVGDRLSELALRGGSSITWLGLQPNEDAGWSLTASEDRSLQRAAGHCTFPRLSRRCHGRGGIPGVG